MRRRRGAAALVTVLLLMGCQGETEPAPPPPSEDALTTADAPVVDTAPTTSPPPDDVEATSAEPTIEAPETTEDSGPPELPVEAQEDSESGAEAFALHYIDMINYTSRYPEVGLLEPLADEACQSCRNHEDSVAYMVEHQEFVEQDGLEVGEVVSLHNPTDSVATVRVGTVQVEQAVLGGDGEVVEEIPRVEATMVIDLAWDSQWSIQAIRVDMGQR